MSFREPKPDWCRQEITIPAGSELLMGAWESETDNSNVNFIIAGVAQPQINALGAVSHLFETAGTYAVSAVHAKSGTTQTLTVHVESADLQPSAGQRACYCSGPRGAGLTWPLSGPILHT